MWSLSSAAAGLSPLPLCSAAFSLHGGRVEIFCLISGLRFSVYSNSSRKRVPPQGWRAGAWEVPTRTFGESFSGIGPQFHQMRSCANGCAGLQLHAMLPAGTVGLILNIG